MELTIYNTYVVMESQEQCDKMKQLCIDNKLPIWGPDLAFRFSEHFSEFSFCGEFYVGTNEYFVRDKTQVTEDQFIELLKSNK